MFCSLFVQEVHAVPKQKDPDVGGFFCCFLCLSPVRGTNYGKEADTWFGSDLDPVIFARFLLVFKSAWCTRWVRLTIKGNTFVFQRV